MRTIRVTYRAVFEQPIGALNPMGCKLPGPFPVEIFGTGERWQAREIASSRRQVYERLSRFTSPDTGKQVVESSFARKIQDWQIWGTVPATIEELMEEGRPAAVERILIPGVDICDLGNNTWGLYGPDDRTHISTKAKDPTAKKFAARCGADVSPKLIVSTRANVEPSCPTCAEIYRQEYANK